MLISMKGEINNNTIIVGDFNAPLTLWIYILNLTFLEGLMGTSQRGS